MSKPKLNVKRVVICSCILVAIIAGIVVLICKKPWKNDKQSNANEQETVNIYDYIEPDEYLQIEADDCSLYIGTEMTLSVTASSDDILQTVVWSSSDTGVATIDDKGHLSVCGSGRTIIKAISGNLTDSVVIIGIDAESETVAGETATEPELPVYVPDENGNLVPKETNASTGNSETTSAGETAGTQVETTAAPAPDTDSTTASDSNPAQTTAAEDTEVNMKDVLLADMSGLGYSKYSSSVDYAYIYEEDGNYLGEVIVNDSFVQIYVQTRTTGFDVALKALIEEIVPGKSTEVFSSFVSAKDNCSIKVDGHLIRIRPGENEEHSQLIISY